MKYTVIILLLVLGTCGPRNLNQVKKKDVSAPKEVQENYQKTNLQINGLKVERVWRAKENNISKFYLYKEILHYGKFGIKATYTYDEDGSLFSKEQSIPIDNIEERMNNPSAPNYTDALFGRVRIYKKGNLQQITCYSAGSSTDSANHGVCGSEEFFNEEGKPRTSKRHPLVCDKGCGEFTPFLEVGAYYKVEISITVRQEPSSKSKYIKHLDEGEIVKVVEDTGKFEEIKETLASENNPNIAPWVKIGYGKNFKETAYVHGSETFLSGPYD